VAVFMASRDNTVFTWLALDQEQATQVWRAISAHWVHIDRVHLGWNLLGLGVLGSLLELERPNLLWVSLLAGSAVVAVWFLVAGPTRYYVGLSGVLNTLLVLVLWSQWQGAASQSGVNWLQRALVLLIACAVLARLLLESVSSVRLTGVENSAPLAHVAGAIAGVLLLALPVVRTGLRQTSPSRPADPGR